jgi:hypothetical protein
LCKKACITYSYVKLVKLMDYTVDTTDYKTGAPTAVFEAAGGYCGAYSFNDAEATAALKCTIKIDDDTATAAAAATGSKCFVMKKDPRPDPETGDYSSKAWFVMQTAVKDAWTPIAATSYALQTAMKGAMTTQAALEKAWLNAYYDNQYWSSVGSLLNPATGGSPLVTKHKTAGDLLGASTEEPGATIFNNLAKTVAS